MSRRGLLGSALGVPGGAALMLAATEPAEAKIAQKAAKYQDTPKGKQQCSSCFHFKPPHSCALVSGKISPHGWCQFYAKRS